MSHAGRLHRLDGADRHLVVVGDHGVELVAGADPVGHQVGALGARPVGGLLFDDRDAGAFGVAMTSWMSWVRWRAAWFDSSPIMIRIWPLPLMQPADLVASAACRTRPVGADERDLLRQLVDSAGSG